MSNWGWTMSFFNFSRDEQQQQRDSGGVRQRPFVNTSLTAGAGQPNANFTPTKSSPVAFSASTYSQPAETKPVMTSSAHETSQENFPFSTLTQGIRNHFVNQFADTSRIFGQNNFGSSGNSIGINAYFLVDTDYIAYKLKTLMFPFKKNLYPSNKELRAPPNVNKEMPDLYIPLMSFLTFIVLTIALRGVNQENAFDGFFTSIMHNVGFFTCEFFVYISLIQTFSKDNMLNYIDFTALLGYRYFSLCLCLLAKAFLPKIFSFLYVIGSGLTFGYFLIKSLKIMLFGDNIFSNLTNQMGTRTHIQIFFSIFSIQPLIYWLYLGYATGFF